MASRQISDNNEKAELEEIMSTEVAKSLIAEANDRNQPGVVGNATNNRGKTLQLLATKNWVGNFFEAPTTSIGAGGRAQILHNGSKGALIYGQQPGASNAAAYLLAWSFGNGPYRVYVKCGPVSEVHYNGWENAALTSLDSSGTESSASHGGTSSRAQANIRDECGSFPLGFIVAGIY
ncbi:hypothetical protein RND81_09G252400 [Saponaria officinalis]|uniref:Uncharacterized protein n=1 Tax=Saponaria officinalis TaxID=3572 RepID=A0AAW1IS57_SAPOF